MSKSSHPGTTPEQLRSSAKYLRFPDAVLLAAGPPERRPSVAVLEKAIAGRQTRTLERPPVRDRIFSRELRSVTGAVINHGAAAGNVNPPANHSTEAPHRPLSPPPVGPKPWLKEPSIAAKRAPGIENERPQAIHVKSDAQKPWLRSPEQSAVAKTEAPPVRVAPPEIVIIEAGDLDAAASTVRGSENIVQWLVVAESTAPAVAEEPAGPGPAAVEPVQNREGPAAEPPRNPPPVVTAMPAIEPAPAAGSLPAVSVVVPEAERHAPAASVPEVIVYADPEPLYGEIYLEPFVTLPHFPESPAVFDVPEVEPQDQIVRVPAAPEPERIADVPEDTLQALFERLAAADDRYVEGIIFEYEYEYVEEDGAAPITGSVPVVANVPVAPVGEDVTAEPVIDPAPVPAMPVHATESGPATSRPEPGSPPPAPGSAPVLRPAVPVLRAAPEFVPNPGLADDALDFIDTTTDADAIKQELFAEISRDHDPGMDLDLALDLDSSIHEEIHGVAGDDASRARAATYTPTAAEEIVDEISAEISAEMAGEEMPRPAQKLSKDNITETYGEIQATETVTGEGERSVFLLDDEELADHLLEPPASAGVITSAQPEIVVLTPAERDALRLRLDRFWHETPSPSAAGGADLLDTLRRLYTVSQPEAHHFDALLGYIQEHSRANALAVLMLDSAQMVYRPLLLRGFDGRTAGNFYLGMDDAFLEYAPDFQILRATDFSDAHHFHKRFSSEFFHRIDGIYLIALRPYGAPGYLALVYEDLNHLTEHVLQSTLPPILKDALPPILRFTREQWEVGHRPVTDESDEKFYEDTSIVDQIYRLLKEVSRGGRDSIEVVHLHFPNLLQQPDWLTRLDGLAATLLARLAASEKMIQATPERITLILKESPAGELLEIARAAASAAELTIRDQVMVYPDHSRNFYNYIAPGF